MGQVHRLRHKLHGTEALLGQQLEVSRYLEKRCKSLAAKACTYKCSRQRKSNLLFFLRMLVVDKLSPECPVCRERCDINERPPVAFLCRHVLCQGCCDEMTRKATEEGERLRCPLCRRDGTHIPKHGVNCRCPMHEHLYDSSSLEDSGDDELWE